MDLPGLQCVLYEPFSRVGADRITEALWLVMRKYGRPPPPNFKGRIDIAL
jgi:hypothetical protein